MHWAPIPIAEFALPAPPSDFAIADEDIFRLLSRAPRRGFWVSALGFSAFVTIGLVAGSIENSLIGIMFFVLGLLAGTAHMVFRHKLNLALWASREPAAVYWAEPRQLDWHLFWTRGPVTSLTLHTPAPVRLDAVLGEEEMMSVLHWLRQRNPEALIGSFSPTDSDGRLSCAEQYWDTHVCRTVCGSCVYWATITGTNVQCCICKHQFGIRSRLTAATPDYRCMRGLLNHPAIMCVPLPFLGGGRLRSY